MGLEASPAQLRVELSVGDSNAPWESRTALEFTGVPEFPIQVAMDRVDEVSVDGQPVRIDDLAVTLGPGPHRAEARGWLQVKDEGPLRRWNDPADGSTSFSLINYPDPLPRGMFSLEQPREPLEVQLSVRAQAGQVVLSHARGRRRDDRWEFDPVQIAPNKLLVFVGPWRLVGRDEAAEDVPIELWQPASLPDPVAPLIADARRALRAYRDHWGLDYPLDRFQIVLAPAVPLQGAFAQGLMVINSDPEAVEALQDPTYRAGLLTHEIGHSWIGGQLDFTQTNREKSPSELLEGLNTYVSQTVLGLQLPGLDPWNRDSGRFNPDLYLRWAQRYRDHADRIGEATLRQRILDLIARHTYRATAADVDRLLA